MSRLSGSEGASERDSWATLRWARDQAVERGLTPIQAHVLLVLATYADASGRCHPGLATLAGIIRRGERETSRALSDLARHGLIERRGRGPGRTRETRLLPDARSAASQDADADSRPTSSHPSQSDSRPASGQPDSRSASSQSDSRPASTKTRGEPLPRLAAHRVQNYQGNNQRNGGSPSPGGHAGARGGTGDEGRPSIEGLVDQVYGILDRGVASLGENDNGRPWPAPNAEVIREAVTGHEPDPALAVRVAKQTREIAQAQDRAPNIARLFANKLSEAAAEHADVRDEIADSFASVNGADDGNEQAEAERLGIELRGAPR